MSATAGRKSRRKRNRASAIAGNPFTLPHWVLALARAGHHAEAVHFIKGMEDFVLRNVGDLSPLVRTIALPLCKAILAQADGRSKKAIDDAPGTAHHAPPWRQSRAAGSPGTEMFLGFAERRLGCGSDADLERIRGRRACRLNAASAGARPRALQDRWSRQAFFRAMC